MGRELQRLKRRKQIISRMDDMLGRASSVLVIHYSCESFYDKTNGKTPRITSIAVRNLFSGQTESFSIHQIAEEKGVAFKDIPTQYDSLEREMLERYFEFIRSHQHFDWVHWNMRDVNYGFAAIEHRYRVLGGSPILIAEEKKFDLSRSLIDMYGVSFINHPRLEMLVEKNGITKKDFLTGSQEATAFENLEFVKLHQSTLRKLDTLANIFERASNEELKTNASWLQQHGYTLRGAIELVKQHWFISGVIVFGSFLISIGGMVDFWSKFIVPILK